MMSLYVVLSPRRRYSWAGFPVYLHFFNNYSKTDGSLEAAIILLLWFYVTGLAFLLGGQINAETEHAAAALGHFEAKATGENEAAQPARPDDAEKSS